MLFNYIVLDTNPLRSAAWPDVPADLENLFNLCTMFRIKVMIPEAVDLELESWWMSTAMKRHENASKAITKLKSNISNPGVLDAAEILDPGRELIRKRKKAGDLKAKWNIGAVPITSVSVETIFKRAASKLPPFGESGKGFKDSVILYSIFDLCSRDVEVSKKKSVALVTRDGDFDEIGVEDLCVEREIELRVFPDFGSVVTELEKSLNNVMKQLRDGDALKAKKALLEHLVNAQTFVEENLEIPVRELRSFPNVEVKSIEINDVNDVRTSYLTERADKESPKISADLSSTLKLVCDERKLPQPSEPRKLKIGQKEKPFATFIATPFFAADIASRVERDLPLLLELEVTATRKDDAYENLVFSSVKIKPQNKYAAAALGLSTPYFGE